jgi:hypothetical protein
MRVQIPVTTYLSTVLDKALERNNPRRILEILQKRLLVKEIGTVYGEPASNNSTETLRMLTYILRHWDDVLKRSEKEYRIKLKKAVDKAEKDGIL